MREAIEFFGVITYICLWLTAIVGFAKWKLRVTWIKPNYHFVLAILALLAATAHLILISLK